MTGDKAVWGTQCELLPHQREHSCCQNSPIRIPVGFLRLWRSFCSKQTGRKFQAAIYHLTLITNVKISISAALKQSSWLKMKVWFITRKEREKRIFSDSMRQDTDIETRRSPSLIIGFPLRQMRMWLDDCTKLNQIGDQGSRGETQHTTTPVWIQHLPVTMFDKSLGGKESPILCPPGPQRPPTALSTWDLLYLSCECWFTLNVESKCIRTEIIHTAQFLHSCAAVFPEPVPQLLLNTLLIPGSRRERGAVLSSLPVLAHAV